MTKRRAALLSIPVAADWTVDYMALCDESMFYPALGALGAPFLWLGALLAIGLLSHVARVATLRFIGETWGPAVAEVWESAVSAATTGLALITFLVVAVLLTRRRE